MNKYETIFILNPTLDDASINSSVDKFKGVIESNGGTVDNVDLWGKRKLAYEINKINEGIYVLMNFTADPNFPKELDRQYRITDTVIRHIILKQEK